VRVRLVSTSAGLGTHTPQVRVRLGIQ
jgi:hypothetical protein